MPAEKKSKGVKITVITAPSLRKKFLSHCKKSNTSMAQRIRDLMQKDMK